MIFNASTLAAFAVTSTAVVVATPTARVDLFEKVLPCSTDGIADMTAEIQASHDEIIPVIDLDATRNYPSSDAKNLLLGDHTLTNARFVEEKFVGDETVMVVAPDSGILHESSHSYDTGMNNAFSSFGDEVQVIERSRGLSAGCAEYAELEDNYSGYYEFRGLIEDCLNYDKCPSNVRDLNCWKTSKVTNMADAFFYGTEFNEDISQWDTSSVTNMIYMFANVAEFNGDLSTWDTSSVTNMGFMFTNATEFNGDLSTWDTSEVRTFLAMFANAAEFNGDLSTWETPSVTNMAYMFRNATEFNGDLSSWDTSEVTYLRGMFGIASKFNGDLSTWDTSSVTNMGEMFAKATEFNGDLSTWDTSEVGTFRGMFGLASKFNGDIDGWDTSSATDMIAMFYKAAEFNGDLSTWETSEMESFQGMFYGATKFNGNIDRWDTSAASNMTKMFLNAENFDQCLSTWASKTGDSVVTDDMLTGSGCSAQTADPKDGPWCQETASCKTKAKNCRNCLRLHNKCIKKKSTRACTKQCLKSQGKKRFVLDPKCNKKCCKSLCKTSDSLKACTKKDYCE